MFKGVIAQRVSFTNNDLIPFMLPQIELRSSLKAKNDAQSKPFMDYQMVRLDVHEEDECDGTITIQYFGHRALVHF